MRYRNKFAVIPGNQNLSLRIADAGGDWIGVDVSNDIMDGMPATHPRNHPARRLHCHLKAKIIDSVIMSYIRQRRLGESLG